MEKNPLLTIVVTTLNNEKTIAKTMRSVLAQTYPNFEVLVSDNGSTDTTLQIVNSFNDARITVRHEAKKIKTDRWYIGGYDNYNGCLQSGQIHGEFVCFYHSDDIYEKDIAKKEVEFLMAHPEAGAVFAMGKIINKDDQVIGERTLSSDLSKKNLYHFTDILENILTYGNLCLFTPTFMARTSIFKNVGLFMEQKFETSADLQMWFRILEKYTIGILNEPLIRRRVGGVIKQYDNLRTRQADYFIAMDHILANLPSQMQPGQKLMAQYRLQKDLDNTIIAMHFVMKNQTQEARRIINGSFSWELFTAFFENMMMLRAKGLALKIILFTGINLGLGKPLGKMFRKIR